MVISSRKHPDTITYWKKGAIDRYGVPTWSAPTIAKVRWEDGVKLYWSEDGREARGRSTIYAQTDILQLGDYVFLGTSAELAPPSGSFEVKDAMRNKNLRGTKTEFRYIA